METVFCYVVKKKLESRRGMVYGPFSLIYGVGALLMTVVLLPLRNHNILLLFLASAVLGGLFETVCSLFLEQAWGTTSDRKSVV